MAQYTTLQPVSVRIERDRLITLHPVAAVLSPATRILLRAIEKENPRERAHRVHSPDRPHRLG